MPVNLLEDDIDEKPINLLGEESDKNVSTMFGDLPNVGYKDIVNPKNINKAIEESQMAIGGGMALPRGISTIGKGVEAISPGKLSEEFIQSLFPGTASENIEEFAKRAKLSKESALNESLIPKKEIYSKKGYSEIIPDKSESHYFADEDVLSPYSKGLKKRHFDFEKKPTLNNYDTLQSSIKDEIRRLEKRDKMKGLDTSGDVKLEQLKINRDNLNTDVDKFMKTLPEDLQGREKLFRTLYAKNVAPFEESGTTMGNLSEGKTAGIKPGSLSKIYESPKDHLQKILSDIGPSGERNVLFDMLKDIDPKDSKKIVEILQTAKQSKGYQKLISPRIEKIMEDISKRIKRKELAKTVGYGLLGSLGGSSLGHPLIGAGAGVLTKMYGPDILKFISAAMRK